MPILRLAHERDYFSCSRHLPQDESISFEAVGLMAYLLSKPDGWEVQFEDIEKRGKFGRDVRRRLFTELEKAGYFERRRIRTDLGQWDYELLVHETPLPGDRRTHLAGEKGNPPSGKPSTESPSPENPSPDKPSTAQPSPEKAAIIENTEVESTERENTERKSVCDSSSAGGHTHTPIVADISFATETDGQAEESLATAISEVCGVAEQPNPQKCLVALTVMALTPLRITAADVRAFDYNWYHERRKTFPLTLDILRKDIGAFARLRRMQASAQANPPVSAKPADRPSPPKNATPGELKRYMEQWNKERAQRLAA